MSAPRTALAASFALLIAACGGSGSGGSPSSMGGAGMGKGFTLLLKDTPASFNAAVVTISEIDLVGSSGQLVLTTTPTTTDLLTLSNDTATLVKDAVVPPGTYSQLRFVITGGYVDVGGTIYASSPAYEGLPPETTVAGKLQMPSYGQSGLKVDLPGGGLDLGTEQKIVVVDFDVSQSFGHQAGNSGMWVMHPVVKATDIVMTGTLEVTLGLGSGPEGGTIGLPPGLSLTDFSAVVTPTAGGDSVTVPLADNGDGTAGATFKYLDPGDYTVTLLPPASVASFATSPPVPVTATITSDHVTTEVFLLTAVVMTGAVDVSLSLAPEVSLPAGVVRSDFQAVLTPEPPLSGAPVALPLTATSTGASATFPNLAPGTYSLDFTLPAPVTGVSATPALPASVTVVSQMVTEANVLITSVTP